MAVHSNVVAGTTLNVRTTYLETSLKTQAVFTTAYARGAILITQNMQTLDLNGSFSNTVLEISFRRMPVPFLSSHSEWRPYLGSWLLVVAVQAQRNRVQQ